MGFVKKTWKDRISEYPSRRRLTKSDSSTELVTVAREEGTISEEGDAFSALNMNALETRILNAIGTDYTKTLVAGATDLIFTDASFTSNSIIADVLTDKWGMYLTDEPVVTAGSITLKFEAQATDVSVIMIVR